MYLVFGHHSSNNISLQLTSTLLSCTHGSESITPHITHPSLRAATRHYHHPQTSNHHNIVINATTITAPSHSIISSHHHTIITSPIITYWQLDVDGSRPASECYTDCLLHVERYPSYAFYTCRELAELTRHFHLHV